MTDQTLLSEARPTARKRYWCALCTAAIEPGETYIRQPLVHDGTVTNWRECAACDTDEIRERAWGWTSNSDGVDSDIAYEWATEAVIHGTPEGQRAAKNYLERTNHD